MKYPALLRHTITVSLLLTAALFLLPLVLVPPLGVPESSNAPTTENSLLPETDQQGAESPGADLDRQVTLRVLEGGIISSMTLEDYLYGVLRAEMPASFAPEALKAQAVAARTYTLYKIHTGGNHGDTADICTDPGCCQAWLAEGAARQNWADNADAYESKIRSAVNGTDGQAMFYGGQPILAAFHSSSAGLTRPAGEVWQNDVPYLQAVTSPEAEDSIPNYFSRAEFSAPDFRAAVLSACPEADLSGPMAGWLTDAVTDSAGSVDTLSVGGVTLKGTHLRSILGLRSACFDWAVEGDVLVFYVTGYGHGVGMSQYGANAMAESGADWREILEHYYTGITIHAIEP